jgi:hypothetical protein
MCGNGEEIGGNEGEDDKGPLAPTSAEAVSSFEDVRYFCFYKINYFNMCRLGTFGETANLRSTFGETERWRERESSWTLSHTTNKADVTPQLFKKVTFQVYMNAIFM